MSKRLSTYVTRRLPFQSPPSPNATVDHITTEIRLFYPPNTPTDLVLDELNRAYVEAAGKVHTWGAMRDAFRSARESADRGVQPPHPLPESPPTAN